MPKWQAVYNHFSRLQARGVWDQILIDLTKKYRFDSGRNPHPSYALIDTQSVKTQYKGEVQGYDGGKKKSKEEKERSAQTLWVTYFV